MKILKLTNGIKKYIFIMLVFCVVQVFCELYLPNIMSDIIDIGISKYDQVFITKEIINMLVVSIVALISNIVVVYSTSKFSNMF